MTRVIELSDPRRYADPATAPPAALHLHRLAAESLSAATLDAADAADRAVKRELEAWMNAGDGAQLAALFATAPSAATYRHLWRLLAAVGNDADGGATDLRVRVFAIPVVIVAGRAEAGNEPAILQGVLDDAPGLAKILRAHGALRGNETIALANALVAADAVDFATLPEWRRCARLAAAGNPAPFPVAPAPMTVGAGEAAHLRFLIGTALAVAGANLYSDPGVERFAAPLSRALERSLARPGLTLLALPRAPADLVTAAFAGRSAQREIAAQLFASHAIRNLRTRFGEPSAVISAHRTTEAPLGGELRVSLSSPFSPRDAEGFRCPLFPGDALGEVLKMLRDLLEDCRVTDVQVVPGLHADRIEGSGPLLLFRADSLPDPSTAIQ